MFSTKICNKNQLDMKEWFIYSFCLSIKFTSSQFSGYLNKSAVWVPPAPAQHLSVFLDAGCQHLPR
jgi:hypothetical protein